MKLLSVAAFFITAIAAQSISGEPNGSNCDGTYYTQQNINDAATAALTYYANGETVGYDNYPHQYNDYESFTFTCSPPYLEFPISPDGTYSGGPPGADRVVIGSVSGDESSAQYCALITHQGESGNGFGECVDE